MTRGPGRVRGDRSGWPSGRHASACPCFCQRGLHSPTLKPRTLTLRASPAATCHKPNAVSVTSLSQPLSPPLPGQPLSPDTGLAGGSSAPPLRKVLLLTPGHRVPLCSKALRQTPLLFHVEAQAPRAIEPAWVHFPSCLPTEPCSPSKCHQDACLRLLLLLPRSRPIRNACLASA